MKILISLIVILSLNTTFNESSYWMTDFEDAKKLAIASNRLILVDFWATWCAPFNKMESESWKKNEIKDLMKSYVPLKINIDYNKTIARKYGISSIPNVLILDGNGKIIYQTKGYMSKNQLMNLLEKYNLNTSYLSKDLINYSIKKNFSNAFRLGVKYQNYSLYLNKSLRSDFIKLSNQYLKKAKSLIKQDSKLNQTKFIQRLGLIEIQSDLILGKTKKGAKQLKKIKKDELDKMNHSLYNFLLYICALESKDEKYKKELEKHLSKSDLKKVEIFKS